MMNRRSFLAATCLPVAGRAPAAVKRPPNILLIMADDMGAKELGCYGNPKHKTPNLDALARTGVQFRTCFATPICHPTRVEILTGQYGCHNGVYNFANMRGGPGADSLAEDIGKSHITFAEVLKKRGYGTAIAGKWQLSGKQPDLIYECGFDEYCMWAFEDYLKPEDKEKYHGRERYWHPAVIRNGVFLRTTPNDYGPDMDSDFLIDFMKRKKDQPFLAYYPMALTHGPHVPTPDTVKDEDSKFKANKAAHYKANVEYCDKIIGKLVRALDQNGLRENTLILFTADNGTAGEGKGQGTELGARVAMIANCPGLVNQRAPSDELVDLSDILPTIAEFAGAEAPKDRIIDGRSFAGYLRGDKAAPREWIFSFIADRRILRTKRWLLEDNSPLHYGKLYDCGSSRDGSGYKDVSSSQEAEVLAVRKKFDRILAKLPAPYIPKDGPANERKRQTSGSPPSNSAEFQAAD